MTTLLDNTHYLLLTTLLVLVLSALACVAPAWAVVPTALTTSSPVLSETPTTVPGAITTPATTVQVTALRSLHIRQQPSEHAVVIGYLYRDDVVALTGKCSDGWAEIEWNDALAWVNARYLSDNKCKEKS